MSEPLNSEIKDCLENGAGTCRNVVLIDELRAEITRRDEYILKLEAKIPKLNIDLAEASMNAYNAEIARMKLEAELARRDASLLTEGKQKEILSYIQGNYDRDKIPTWLLDLIDGITSRNEIIKRLKEDGERLAYYCVRRNHFAQYACVLCDAYADTIEEIQHDPDCDVLKHRTLMKELN